MGYFDSHIGIEQQHISKNEQDYNKGYHNESNELSHQIDSEKNEEEADHKVEIIEEQEEPYRTNNIFDFYNNRIEDFEDIYNQHIKKVNEEQKISFNIKALSEYVLGVNPKIITIKNNNELQGIIITSYENTSDNILNISALGGVKKIEHIK